MNSLLPQHEIVLVGAGHTNAHILRMWRMHPIPNARLTCVTDHLHASYSGMLPGALAGLYPRERMLIDLARLCAASNVRLVREEIVGLNRADKQLLLAARPPLPYDLLSIGIGSVPSTADIPLDGTVLLIKPMQTFLSRLDAKIAQIVAKQLNQAKNSPARIAVVGAGAGGLEITFCLPPYLKEQLCDRPWELCLIDGHATIGGGLNARARRAAEKELARRDVKMFLGTKVAQVEQGRLTFSDGRTLDVDLVLWATSARAQSLLQQLDLATDPNGFLLTRETLQSQSDDAIFAVGDSGTSLTHPTPKAGVYAVRQGPILWENLARALKKEPLLPYRPQTDFLKLLSTGDGRAILAWRGFAFHAPWCWKWKSRIDGRFMDMYQDYRPSAMPSVNNLAGDSKIAMRCAGCGGKIGGDVLGRVIKKLRIPPSDHVLVGLDQADDVALIRAPANGAIALTVDFFSAFIDDPYLVGRVAALNAASDLFAKGAQPIAALALATIPLGPARRQEELLFELLSGSLHEFKKMGATLVGGHTIEGAQTTLGFSMTADISLQAARLKGSLRPGDLLVLTKPLGSGLLLAANMQARCQAEWLERLLPLLTVSNQQAACLAAEHDVRGMTDVTGFGLAGHLLEMLRAGNVAAEIKLREIPLLPGVEELVREGLQSTLAPANRGVEAEMEFTQAVRDDVRYAPLFDPQTSGGLLFGVAEGQVQELLRKIESESGVRPAVIGRVMSEDKTRPRLRVQ